MGSDRVSGGRYHDNDMDGEKFVIKQLEGKAMPGDSIWAKQRGNMWWPAMVVDENTVSESNKPYKRASGSILVRLYGSYEYLYVDPIKCHSELQEVLEQNNGSYRELFEKALDRELTRCSSKGKRSKSTEGSGQKKLKPNNTSDEERKMNEISMKGKDTKNKTPKGNKKHNPDSPNSETSLLRTSHELSARRLRVMRSLGLIAPSGSPFSRNGQINVSS